MRYFFLYVPSFCHAVIYFTDLFMYSIWCILYKLERNFVTARTFFGFILDTAFRISLAVNGIVIGFGGMIVLGCLFL